MAHMIMSGFLTDAESHWDLFGAESPSLRGKVHWEGREVFFLVLFFRGPDSVKIEIEFFEDEEHEVKSDFFDGGSASWGRTFRVESWWASIESGSVELEVFPALGTSLSLRTPRGVVLPTFCIGVDVDEISLERKSPLLMPMF